MVDDQSLQKQGAEARAQGVSFLDNPFLKADQLPGPTGISVEEWSRRNDQWEVGWRFEDSMRGF